MRALAHFDPRLGEIHGHTFFIPALKPGSTVLDLGAAGGGFAFELAESYGCRCFVAEPLPEAFRQIPRHPRLRAFPVAITGVNGPFQLRDRATHHGSASYFSFDGIAEKGAMEVESVTIERFLEMAGLTQVDLLKLDIEGAEFDALRATSDDTLRAVAQMTVEFHDFLDTRLSAECEAVIARLDALGFDTIRFSRHHHGDVLFLNRRFIALSPAELFWLRQVVRPVRGLGRIVARRITRPSITAPSFTEM